MPAAFKAVSSSCSPILPKEISDVSSTAMGRAIGTSDRAIYQKNCISTSKPRPLPTSESMCFHTNCIMNTNRQMQKQPKKSRKNFLSTKTSIFFINFKFAVSSFKSSPKGGGTGGGILLMLLPEQVVYCLYGIERAQRHLHEDGVPVAHGSVPESG